MSKARTGGCSRTRPCFFDTNHTRKSNVTNIRSVLALAAMLAIAACSSTPPLANASSSPEAHARAVLDALQARDRTRLEGLALSQQEFEDHVWPSLPAARPERNLPLSYVWGDLHQKSTLALTNTLNAHGGQRYELLGVSFAEVTPYSGYRVHRQAVFRVRDAAGTETDVRISGSMIEQAGAWKIFSYVVD